MLVSKLQGAPVLPQTSHVAATVLDEMVTGTVVPRAERAADAIRLIDLKSGATCKMARPTHVGTQFSPAPVGPDCTGSADLQRIAQWRNAEDGSLEMADADGRTVYRFIPGDGVLFESVYPNNALVTIVPARG
ncbi:hypothetical protein ASG48_04780 [Aurantimonas sp. Leaf443]|nr:hypothetical protein ASG48_04780 [Aurantimonas sp. Leaf443]